MSNRQSIPLLQMFPQCVLGGDTLEAAQSCQIYNAAIHQSTRSVELEVSFAVPPAEQALEELKRLNENITDEKLSRQLDHIQATTEKIFAFVLEHPEKKGQIRRFQDYYLPTTIKLLNAYDRMDNLGVSGANIDASKGRVEQMLTTVETAYDKQLDALFQDEAMDISADVTVLEQMMAQEGLTDSGPRL